jgi:hypothetical protein
MVKNLPFLVLVECLIICRVIEEGEFLNTFINGLIEYM